MRGVRGGHCRVQRLRVPSQSTRPVGLGFPEQSRSTAQRRILPHRIGKREVWRSVALKVSSCDSKSWVDAQGLFHEVVCRQYVGWQQILVRIPAAKHRKTPRGAGENHGPSS